MSVGSMGAVTSARNEPDRPQLPGVTDLWTLLRAFDNRKALDDFLLQWSKIVAGYDKSVEAMGGIGKIGELRAEVAKELESAQARNDEAAKVVSDARTRAVAMVEKAKDEAISIVGNAKAEQARLTALAEKLASDAELFNRTRLQTENGFASRETALKKQEEEAAALKAQLDERAARLRAALG
jgi:chemotaxis regulatin CheY-phosphate phosphatase CheZ